MILPIGKPLRTQRVHGRGSDSEPRPAGSSGVSVGCRVKTGPVTLLAMTQTAECKLKLLAAEGESIAGPLLKIGSTNSRVRFALPPGEFINRWCSHAPTHHVALGVGHVRAAAKVAELMGIALEVVE
jgi:L-arabinose isomerase